MGFILSGSKAHATAVERHIAQGTHTAVARGVDEAGIAIGAVLGIEIIAETVLILVHLLLHDRGAGGEVVEVLALEGGTADIEEAIAAVDTGGRGIVGMAAVGVDGIGRRGRRGRGTIGERRQDGIGDDVGTLRAVVVEGFPDVGVEDGIGVVLAALVAVEQSGVAHIVEHVAMVESDAARALGVDDAHGLAVVGAALVVVDDGVLEGGLTAVTDPHGGTLR